MTLAIVAVMVGLTIILLAFIWPESDALNAAALTVVLVGLAVAIESLFTL